MNLPPPCRFSTTTATCRSQEIADDKKFDNLTRIWLNGDHYKWRAMRANGDR